MRDHSPIAVEQDLFTGVQCCLNINKNTRKCSTSVLHKKREEITQVLTIDDVPIYLSVPVLEIFSVQAIYKTIVLNIPQKNQLICSDLSANEAL